MTTVVTTMKSQCYIDDLSKTCFRFNTTSTMLPTGSAYSSTPNINYYGEAIFGGKSESSENISHSPRRIAPITPEGDPTPIGDIPYLMLTCFLIYYVYKKKTASI